MNVSYVEPKAVLVLRDLDGYDEIDFGRLAADTNCTVVALPPGGSLETLDEEAMAAAGWFRQTVQAPQLEPCDCGTHMKRPAASEAS